MAIRWRKDGRLMCAAMTEPEAGDTYIGDRLSYELTVIQEVIIADPNHKKNALWHWEKEEVKCPRCGGRGVIPSETPWEMTGCPDCKRTGILGVVTKPRGEER